MCVCVQVPTVSMSVEGSPALNRLRWSQSGREIAVGDSEGQIHIYDVGEVSRVYSRVYLKGSFTQKGKFRH